MSLDFTQRLLQDAGIEAGMTVLDIGCGAGGLSALLTELVQDTGTVVGIDRNENAIAKALAEERQDSNLSFIHAGLFELNFPNATFDALVGRRILMYLADPAAALRQLSPLVKTGRPVRVPGSRRDSGRQRHRAHAAT